jgi:hypothetical protein
MSIKLTDLRAYNSTKHTIDVPESCIPSIAEFYSNLSENGFDPSDLFIHILFDTVDQHDQINLGNSYTSDQELKMKDIVKLLKSRLTFLLGNYVDRVLVSIYVPDKFEEPKSFNCGYLNGITESSGSLEPEKKSMPESSFKINDNLNYTKDVDESEIKNYYKDSNTETQYLKVVNTTVDENTGEVYATIELTDEQSKQLGVYPKKLVMISTELRKPKTEEKLTLDQKLNNLIKQVQTENDKDLGDIIPDEFDRLMFGLTDDWRYSQEVFEKLKYVSDIYRGYFRRRNKSINDLFYHLRGF